MCLNDEWFDGYQERDLLRNQNGVSLAEAESTLNFYNGTHYPKADEMASWLYRNYTMENLMRLSPAAKEIVLRSVIRQSLQLGIGKKRKRQLRTMLQGFTQSAPLPD